MYGRSGVNEVLTTTVVRGVGISTVTLCWWSIGIG